MKLLERLKTRWAVWVWNHTPNCAEMSKLASQSLDRKLPFKPRFQMRLHFVICRWCQRYSTHLRFLREAAPRLDARLGGFPKHGLSADARRRILQRIREAQWI